VPKEPQDMGKRERRPYRVRVPGFLDGETKGLGDVIKQVTHSFGVRPCAGCERRAATLNRWATFAGRSR
jgi:hypothetical protein